jgi:hypothetical protein
MLRINPYMLAAVVNPWPSGQPGYRRHKTIQLPIPKTIRATEKTSQLVPRRSKRRNSPCAMVVMAKAASTGPGTTRRTGGKSPMLVWMEEYLRIAVSHETTYECALERGKGAPSPDSHDAYIAKSTGCETCIPYAHGL